MLALMTVQRAAPARQPSLREHNLALVLREVADRGPASAARVVGRPGSALALARGGPLGVGVEINVDYLAACTVDLSGAVVQREVVLGDLRELPLEVVLRRAAGVVD